MKTIIKKTGEILLIGIFSVSILGNAIAANLQDTLKSQFDIVETFDELVDWVGTQTGDVDSGNDMPVKNDGTASLWGYYSFWGSYPAPEKWIKNHGDNNVWNPTSQENPKSLCIDMGTTKKGPSRLGLYMGTGYGEIYLFYMVNIPKNEFPTSISGGVGSYTEGEPYTWYSSWKFGNFNLNCSEALCGGSGPNYGEWYFTPHIKVNNYSPIFGPTYVMEARNHVNDQWAKDAPYNLYDMIGDWFGVEWHIKNVGGEVHVDMWTYSKDGLIVRHQMDDAVWTDYDVSGKNWNNFMFGGNNSSTYSWGDTMQSAYYIDDFIVDNQQIGPRYFEVISSYGGTDDTSSGITAPPSLDIISVQQ